MSDIPHRNNVRIEARQGGRLIGQNVIPTNAPADVFKFIGQALGGLQVAMMRKHTVVVCVCPRWKAWILQHVLRCTK